MKLLCIGEAMVELSGAGEGLYRSGFAGDTLNTAWYAQAALKRGVGYLTAVGKDDVSARMASFIAAAGIETSRIQIHADRTVGLYMIALEDGERSFTYWRDMSAAKTLADDPAKLRSAFEGVEMLYFSGITLAILSPQGRANLLAALAHARGNGAIVAFDPNLRPRLWRDTDQMTHAVMEAARVCDIALPSFEDEADAFGDPSLQGTAARYAQAGVAEVVVKNGGGDMLLHTPEGLMQVAPNGGVVQPVDTTGAGDSFNGAYLAARINGAAPLAAAQAGHETARKVINHPGALVPFDRL